MGKIAMVDKQGLRISRWFTGTARAASVLFLIAFAQPVRADVTYSYTGSRFTYVGTGRDVTNVTGSFTVASALQANSTQNLTVAGVGGKIIAYRFTDGRSTWESSNYVASDDFAFSVTTDANGNLVSWQINAFSSVGSISSCTACSGGQAYDNVSVSYNYNAFNFNLPGIWTRSDAVTLNGSAYEEIAPTFNGSDGNQSFIRLGNGGATATTFAISVLGSPSGTLYGRASVQVPANASPQFSLQQILAAASAGQLTGGDTSYSLYLRDSDPGLSYQHVIYNVSNGFFENVSSCKYVASADYTGLNYALGNVHTSQLSAYPTQISIHNYAAAATTYNATVYDAATGSLIGTVPVTVGANATYSAPFTWFQEQLHWTPAAGQSQSNVVFAAAGTAPFEAKVNQYVYNSILSAYVNMTQRCGMSTASGAVPNFALSLRVSGAGAASGSVTSSPAGLLCGGTCGTANPTGSGSFPRGTQVALTAVPASGSVFLGWDGACSGTGSCNVVMNANQSVTAAFGTTAPIFSLAVAVSGSGGGTVSSSPTGIACGSTCIASFASGAAVQLIATAANGSTFQGWSGACTGSGACSVTMNASQSVVAVFNSATPPATKFNLTVTDTGNGSGLVVSSPSGISCGANCTASYAAGTTVALTATPGAGSTFQGWGGACSGTGNCAVLLNANQSVTANFVGAAAPTSITYCGSFTGTYGAKNGQSGGRNSGTFFVVISSDGTISGEGHTTFDSSGTPGGGETLIGHGTPSSFSGTGSGGSVFSGSIQNGNLSGFYTNSEFRSSGTITGSRCS